MIWDGEKVLIVHRQREIAIILERVWKVDETSSARDIQVGISFMSWITLNWIFYNHFLHRVF